jgi:hypothetical protein
MSREWQIIMCWILMAALLTAAVVITFVFD